MAVTEADIPRIAKDSAAIYRKWQPLIDRYHGGVPPAAMAVRMKVESGGRMINVDAPGGGSLQEVGLLSITKGSEERFGVPDGTRMTPEGNVWLGAARYNYDTAWFLQTFPGLAKSYADAHVFGGQLVSAIGIGAASYLFRRARADGLAWVSYRQFAEWAEREESSLPTSGPWGSQSRDTIVYRVRAMWVMDEAGKVMQRDYGISNEAGVPVIPQPPEWLKTFTVPKGVAIGMESRGSAVPVVLGLLGAWLFS